MLDDKIVLTNDLKQFIRITREQNGFVLSDFEKKINHSPAWLSQVESNRIKSIKRKDLIDIFKFMLNKSNEDAELYIENYLNRNNPKDNQKQFEEILYSLVVNEFPNSKEISINIKGNSITITTLKTFYGL